MIKKIKHSLLAIILAGLVVSCNNADTKTDQNVESENHIEDHDQSKQEANKEEENNQEEKENPEEINTEDEEESEETKIEATDEETVEEPMEDDDLISNDGIYYTSYDPTSYGEINEYGMPTIESWKIEGDILTVKGSLQYPYPDGEYIENNIHTFKLTDQTTYTGVGGDGEFEMSKEDILSAPAPSNTITVKDGIVTNIRFSSWSFKSNNSLKYFLIPKQG